MFDGLLSALGGPRRRTQVFLVGCAVVAVGLLSRAELAERWVHSEVGDTLWATCAVLLFAWVLPRARTWTVGGLGLGLAVLVEISQLWRVEWLDSMRAHPIGALFLGQGFVWSDLVCYAIGAVVGVLLDRWLLVSDQAGLVAEDNADVPGRLN